MGFNPLVGAGLAEGIDRAANTLMQVQIAKAKIKQDEDKWKVERKYKEAQTDFLGMKLDATAQQAQMSKDAHTKALQELTKKNSLEAMQTGTALGAGDTNEDGSSPSGGLIGSMSAGGALAPSQPSEADIQAQMAKDLPAGASMKYGGTTLKGAGGGMGSAMMNQAEKNAPGIAKAVKNGDYEGYNGADRYTKAAVARILGEQGVNITQQELEFKSKQTVTQNVKTQDAKVNQAIHLRALANQYYEPSTATYNIPQAQYSEMVMGLANLVANSNTATDSSRKEINQRTAQGDINGLASYLTGTPKNATTQEMMKNLIDSIDRQGKVAEQERDTYIKKGYGNSFNEYLDKSPSQKNGGKAENPEYKKYLDSIGQ